MVNLVTIARSVKVEFFGGTEVHMRSHWTTLLALLTLGLTTAGSGEGLPAGEARRRFERLCRIRQEKFDLILPQALRENGVDMWIVVLREGQPDPLYEDLGRGYVMGTGYYVFSDRGGERIERAVLGIDNPLFDACPAYDVLADGASLRSFVAERAPKRIAVNVSEHIGAAGGLSQASYVALRETLGEPWAGRLVSAEKVVSDFRSRRTAAELVAFGEALELSRTLAERALSNEVVTPGVTTLLDVSWWLQEQLLARGLGSSFDTPSVYVTGPKGIEAVSTARVIERGDFLIIDWGVCHLNFCTDVKRQAYVLKPGESAPPAGLQHAYDVALAVRALVRRTIRPGRTAQATLEAINAELERAGYAVMTEFNKTSPTTRTEVIVGCHSVGNQGHGAGPSIAWFNPRQLTFEIKPSNLFSIEFFAWTPAPEWGGRKVRIPLEDDAVVTERGVEWLGPVAERILLVR